MGNANDESPVKKAAPRLYLFFFFLLENRGVVVFFVVVVVVRSFEIRKAKAKGKWQAVKDVLNVEGNALKKRFLVCFQRKLIIHAFL